MPVSMSENMSFFSLIVNASILVQLVMVALLVMSLVSWWYIFLKREIFKDAFRSVRAFEGHFASVNDPGSLYQHVRASKSRGALDRIFESALREFTKLQQQTGMSLPTLMDGTRRAMNAQYQRELDRLEMNLSFLATVGSVSPYVGLFGTVWGIMNAFRGLANVGQATLAQVAPGIAEALIATAMGLFAAIPAVLAYNRYVRDVERLTARYESGMEEISNLLQRSVTVS
ncbi:MAG: protein TolQ [Betaproteobacteria bacterium]|jgi:biopolymer transport protein TolQ|nr:protein TolQ [Betaproteobacteria bacterium]MBT6184543.1 protein TolQ [Betaproteobacteria bacterium]MBT6530929.1 protein TolQ [Betaproteobacteria bacterium]MBT7426747.1 protein TolQ [Betaproteobacteria bacterium]MBT7998518.1 protein TolQ [Betaproteobacteria bacterium]